MRDDLLDAIAGVEWADAQLPILELRIEAWRNIPPYEIVEELYPQNGEKAYKLTNTTRPPAIINAEAGLVINSLRSSLDLLANALAERNGSRDSKDTQFPVCRDQIGFRHGKHAGRKEIRRLSVADQNVIERLEPWAGGHPYLYRLHALDNIRKHRRLIGVEVMPIRATVSPIDAKRGFRFTGVWKGFENDAIVGWAPIDAPKADIQISPVVLLREGGPVATLTLLEALNKMCGAVRDIIALFDTA